MPYKKNTKYLSILLFLFVLTFGFSQNNAKFKVVLDAGHGGKDPGAVKNGVKEKDVALAVVLKIGKILEKNKDIEVIYTRKTDVFVELRERANIANKAKANLFVSVHCNSVKSGNPIGAMTLVMGMSRTDTNLEIAKTENAVIFQETDYKKKYKGFDPNNPETLIGLKIMQEEALLQSIELATLVQNQFKSELKRKDKGVRQQPLWVLDATVMPGVLIELGFVSHAEEAKYLNSDKGKTEMSESVSNAILSYKTTFFNTDSNQVNNEVVSSKIENDSDIKDSKSNSTYYKVQICAGSKKLETKPSNFKGLKGITFEKDKKLYKYFYGEESDYNACKKKLEEAKKKGYTSAYIVTFTN
ncbi:N-acetylmuramoyl-L-alanine amidase family protein [Flavobacterium channae]|uniref:N-acetylmuramoyl-L-alanine amidase family protein n=1 Tax=Flavobacterium channae TaxID=2897181 RepID=UPI001E41395A|nr:N-acetylmuramoyl-L-alanine amidase [Flavobacterium channae]UGS22490.1 N-acetylmuramoyl-L-alanine amidase [Flavobacterium channae]